MTPLIIHHLLNNRRVKTADGQGTIVSVEGKEGILSQRFAIELDENVFAFSPAYYRRDEFSLERY